MQPCYTTSTRQSSVPITVLTQTNFKAWLDPQSKRVKTWIKSNHFTAKPDSLCLLPNQEGSISKVLLGVDDPDDFWAYATLATRLPKGTYRFSDSCLKPGTLTLATMAWGLHCYRFNHYKESKSEWAKLFIPETVDKKTLTTTIEAIYLVRDLINTPTEDMGPEQLSKVTRQLAKQYEAKFKQIVGPQLLKQNYPAIHAVGRASTQAPRLLEMSWGNPRHPRVTLVGKGVCFDTGGLDIKTSQGMRLMKKDMGGAANVLGLAKMIMAAKLPLRLQVLIPEVENAVAGNAYRPGDIIASRKGLSIEIGNTDAEGRVVLADALARACETKPELLIDFATLTGAARVAVGTDIAAMFTNDDQLAMELTQQAEYLSDHIFRLPLHQPYRKLIDSPIADINNAGTTGYGGAITAALFLQEFIDDNVPWVHFDIMAWNTTSRSGRPEGGEAMAIRAVFAYLQAKFGK